MHNHIEQYLLSTMTKGHPSRPQVQAVTEAALSEHGGNGEAVWELGKQALASSQWEYHGNADLDDTADTAYTLPIYDEQTFATVVAGIVAYAAEHKNAGFVIRDATFRNGQGFLTMSVASSRALQALVPGMQLPKTFLSAGHKGTEQFDPDVRALQAYSPPQTGQDLP